MTDLATHLTKLGTHLARFHETGIANLINGQDVAAADWFETRSPVDESLIARVALGTAQTIDAAAQAAKAAFPAWAAMPGDQRKAILHRVADGIEARAEEIALCECWDTGQAWRFMSKAALRGAENFRFFADLAPGARDGQSLPTPTHWNVTSRNPIGPVGVITPWNTPFMLSTWKIAPALAAGCTVVHKPAEFSPLSARLLAEICHKAGLPPGVLNLVNGLGEGAGRAGLGDQAAPRRVLHPLRLQHPLHLQVPLGDEGGLVDVPQPEELHPAAGGSGRGRPHAARGVGSVRPPRPEPSIRRGGWR